MKKHINRITLHDQLGLNPIQGWFNIIYCISIYKKKTHIIITIDTEEAFYKFQQLFFYF